MFSETHALGGPFGDTSSTPKTDRHHVGSPTPERIGRYEVRQRLGAGALGTVYRAYDSTLDREVAVKLQHPDRVGRPEDAALARLPG